MSDQPPTYLAVPAAVPRARGARYGASTLDERRGRTTVGHVAALDGLRALAAVAVLVSHYGERPLVGTLAVHCFFVLSGFLITGILLRVRSEVEGVGGGRRPALTAFYARRALRIAPPYYATLAAALLLGGALRRDVQPLIGWNLTFLSNVGIALADHWPGSASHLWSLAVEEQFYLVWPALMFLLPRRWLRPTVAGVIAASPLWRAVATAAGVPAIARYVLPPGAMDSLGVGALLAMADAGERAPRWLRWGLVAAVPTFVATVVVPACAGGPCAGATAAGRLLDPLQCTAFAIISAWVIRAASRPSHWTARLLAWRPLVAVGRVSYGVYLYHLFVPPPILSAARRLGIVVPAGGPWMPILYSAITLAVAALSWTFLEAPLVALKRRFPYQGDRRLSADP